MNPTRLHLETLVFIQKYAKQQNKAGLLTSAHSGTRLSRFKGRGMEFDEVRPYQSGDDIRQIDWKVTARTGFAHTKLFREERDRPVWVCCDFSQSMFFATRKQLKSVLAAYHTALQLWQAYDHKDRTGGIIFNEQQQHIIKPVSSQKGLLYLLQKCVDLNNQKRQGEAQEKPKHNINSALKELHALCKTGNLLVIISDFYQLEQSGYDQIIRLARHNEILIKWVVDPFEIDLPKADFTVTDGKKYFNLKASNPKLRQQYLLPFRQIQQQLKKLAQHPSIHCVIAQTQKGPLGIEPLL